MRKRDMWLWNPGLYWPVIFGSIISALVVATVFYLFLGSQALFLVLFGLIGPILGLIHGIVGKKVIALKERLKDEDGLIAECLIVINRLQSPGFTILTGTTLRLIPIVGESQSIDRADMDSVKLTRFFNGKSLLWKKWLVLSTKPRLGFALPESTADEWYADLTRAIPE